MSESIIYPCSHCGTANRIPTERKGKRIRCGKCGGSVFPDRPEAGDTAGFAQSVMASPLPVLVDFWAEWCGPCRTLGPVLETIASQFSGRMKVVKINVDENPSLANRFSIRSIPTMLLVVNGKVVDTLVGALPQAALLQRIQPWLDNRNG